MQKRTITLIAFLCVTIAVASLGLVWSPHQHAHGGTTAQTSPAVSQAIADLRNLKRARLDAAESDIDHIIAELSGSATPAPTVSPTPVVTASPTPAPTPALTPTATSTPISPPTAVPGQTASPTATPTSTTLAYPFTYTLPPSIAVSALPTDAACADTIAAHRATGGDPNAGPVERDSENAIDNQRSPLRGYTLQNGTVIAPFSLGNNGNSFFTTTLARWTGQGSPDIEAHVSGDFTSASTDEIIQWAACKWGLDVNVVRAQVENESDFFQPILGDCTAGQQSYAEISPCQSFGIIGLRGGDSSTTAAYTGAWPYGLDSTAFNLDYSLGVRRACFMGRETYLGSAYAAGDLWGCVGTWFSGQWHDSGADSYMRTVQGFYNTQNWKNENPGAVCTALNSWGRCLQR